VEHTKPVKTDDLKMFGKPPGLKIYQFSGGKIMDMGPREL
jgi:hypothetical protein